MPKDGRYYRRMIGGFQCIFASTIFFGTEDQPGTSRLIDWARFHFFDSIHLWFTEKDGFSSNPHDETSNTISLSEAFYNEIDQHRVPMEREVVIALANSPGVLDFYVWLAWKSWVLKTGKVFIPLFAPGGLRDQLGCRNHPEDRFLRRKLKRWLRIIRAHWPQKATNGPMRDGNLRNHRTGTVPHSGGPVLAALPQMTGRRYYCAREPR